MTAPYRACAEAPRGGHRPPGSAAPCIMEVMGFNPFRVHRRNTAVYVIVAVALAVIVALVVWAAL